MRVLVLWAEGRNANLGVSALAQGMASLARQVWGEDTRIEFQDFGPSESGVSFGGTTVARDLLSPRVGPVAHRLRNFDVVLDTGAGDSFTDAYGLKRLAIMTYVQRTAHRLGIPIVLGPQTIGPFSSAFGRALARANLARAASVIARDSVSGHAAEQLGRAPDVVATDVVFALPRQSVTKTRDVVLNVSGLLWSKNPHIDHIAYRAAVHTTIRGLRQAGRDLTLLAHVVGPDVPMNALAALDNDTPVLSMLRREYSHHGLEFVAPKSLVEARQVVGSAQIVLASRMHACLNAISMGTPAIALAYSRKFAPLMEDLGWRHSLDLRQQPDFAPQLMSYISDASESFRLAQEVPAVLETAGARLDRALSALRSVNLAR